MTHDKKIRTTRVADHGDEWHGPSVEMTTEDNVTIVINLPLVGDANPGDPVNRALEALVALADGARREIENRKNGNAGNRENDTDEQLTEGLEDTFPASDPVSITSPSSSPKQDKASA